MNPWVFLLSQIFIHKKPPTGIEPPASSYLLINFSLLQFVP